MLSKVTISTDCWVVYVNRQERVATSTCNGCSSAVHGLAYTAQQQQTPLSIRAILVSDSTGKIEFFFHFVRANNRTTEYRNEAAEQPVSFV